MLPGAFKGSIFLLSLVLSASMMPVEKLPLASWQTALGLGFVSAVFDNIPLTALALKQDGYDWGFLAYAVGFGGSMIWFGSSAGVALSNIYPEAKSVVLWLRHGWHVALAYVIGFFVLLAVLGWQPQPKRVATTLPATSAAPATMPSAVAPVAPVVPKTPVAAEAMKKRQLAGVAFYRARLFMAPDHAGGGHAKCRLSRHPCLCLVWGRDSRQDMVFSLRHAE